MFKKILIAVVALYAIGYIISLFAPTESEVKQETEQSEVIEVAAEPSTTGLMSVSNLIKGGRTFVENIYGKPTEEKPYTGSYCKKKCTKYIYGDGIELIMEGSTVINFSVFDRQPTCTFSAFAVPEYFDIEVRPDFHDNGQMRWDDYLGYKIGIFDTGGDINFNIVKGDR